MGNCLPFMLFRGSCFQAINLTCHSKFLRQSADSWYFVIVYPLHVHEIDTDTFKRVIWDLLITVNISFSALQNWNRIIIIITIYLLFWMIIWIFDWWTYGASLDKTVKNSNICHLSVTAIDRLIGIVQNVTLLHFLIIFITLSGPRYPTKIHHLCSTKERKS